MIFRIPSRILRVLTIVSAGLMPWFAPATATAEVKAINHDMTLRLDPRTRSLSVRDHMRVQGSDETVFHLAPALIITGIKIDGQVTTRSRHGDTLRINLGAAGEHQVLLEYRGRLSQMPERTRPLDRAPLITSPAGSYLGAGSAWHPTVDSIAASYRLTLILPDPQKAVVPGRLIEEGSTGGQYRAVFKSEIPTQGIVLIAGPFDVKERQHGDIVLRTYFPPGLKELSPGYLQSTADYIDLYKSRIGAYPFSSFFIVSGPLPVGLGFPGMTYIGEKVIQLPFIRFTSLGHEVLHNWWGNGVEIDYDHGNWAEGLTTYMADYAFAGQRSEGNDRRMRTEWLRDYAALPPRRDQAVRTFVSRRHDAAQIIGYNKVAFIFHMLERRIGKEKFLESIRKFWRQYKFRTAGWTDIRKPLKRHLVKTWRRFSSNGLIAVAPPGLS